MARREKQNHFDSIGRNAIGCNTGAVFPCVWPLPRNGVQSEPATAVRPKDSHSLFWGHWYRVKKEYKGFLLVEHLVSVDCVLCSLAADLSLLIPAVALLAFRFWEYLSGR